MKWSDWFELTEAEIDANAAEKPGVYRIAVPDGYAFRIRRSTKKVAHWFGIITINDEICEKIKTNAPIRITNEEGIYYTDLVYIGQSSEDDIKTRLRAHLKDPKSGVYKLLSCYKKLCYSYAETTDADDEELGLYEDFVEATGPYKACPPCDRGSPQCRSASGKNLPLYVRTNAGDIRIK